MKEGVNYIAKGGLNVLTKIGAVASFFLKKSNPINGIDSTLSSIFSAKNYLENNPF